MTQETDEVPPWDTYSELLDDGAVLGMAFADEPDLYRAGSSFEALRALAETPPPTWTAVDARFANECVRGFVGVVGYQMRGLAQLTNAAHSVYLHPLVTLVRGVAEASGALWWHMEPWIDRTEHGSELSTKQWARQADRVVVRAQLRHVVELANRRRRARAAHGEAADEFVQAEQKLIERKEELRGAYGHDATLSGDARRWKLSGESIPDWSELVHHALEFGHGQRFDGKMTQQIYPLLSGFAHPSLDMLYAHTPAAGPLTPRLTCSPTSARLLVSTAGRIAAAAYEIASELCGIDGSPRQDWENAFDATVVMPHR